MPPKLGGISYVQLLLALLIGDTAAGLASRLAGSLALTAATILCALAQIAGLNGLDMLHDSNLHRNFPSNVTTNQRQSQHNRIKGFQILQSYFPETAIFLLPCVRTCGIIWKIRKPSCPRICEIDNARAHFVFKEESSHADLSEKRLHRHHGRRGNRL